MTTGWRYRSAVLSVLTAVGAIACVALTYAQLGWWKDSEQLFRHALKVTKANYLAHNNLGTALDQQNRMDEAAAEFQAALKCRPGYAEAHKNLGAVREREG